jgi:hypothetical protein
MSRVRKVLIALGIVVGLAYIALAVLLFVGPL